LENEVEDENPLRGGGVFPKSGSVEHAEQLLSLVRFGGLLTPDEIQSGLSKHRLPDRGKAIAELQSAFDSLRERHLSANVTTRAERYANVTDSDVVSEFLEGVDAVVVSGFRRLSELDKEVLRKIYETTPVTVVHPTVADSDSDSPIDRGTEEVLDNLMEMGFTRENITAKGYPAERIDTANLLYTHTQGNRGPLEHEEVSLRHMPTPTREVRHIARDIREKIASDESPDDISIYLPDQGRYLHPLTVVCSQYKIPLSLEKSVQLTQTAVGNAVSTVLELARDTATADDVAELVGNPLVDLESEEDRKKTLSQSVSGVTAQLSTSDIDRLVEELEEDYRKELESILKKCRSLQKEPLGDAISTLRGLLEELGIIASVEEVSDRSDLSSQLEVWGLNALETELDTLEGLAEEYQDNQSVERLLRTVRLSQVSGDMDGGDKSVSVRSFEEAAYDVSKVVYVPGLTSEYYPSTETDMRFSRPIKESDSAFDSPESNDIADQAVAFLVASDTEVNLSYPVRSIDGDEFVIAPIVRELLRVTDLNDEPAQEIDLNYRPGSFEDLQREFSEFEDAVSEGNTNPAADAERAIEEIGENEEITEEQENSLRNGVNLARNRRLARLTEYDGILSPETTEQLHPEEIRHPYSPSRLERYSKCGFKYYMKTVLEFEPEDEIQEEMDNLAQGSFIHNSLERFTSEIQDRSDPQTWQKDIPREKLEDLLLECALKELEETEVSDSIFDVRWLEKVLAGLGDQDDNRYYAEDWSAGQPEGLFVNFLNNEEDLNRETLSRLWLAEERVGEDTYGPNPPLQDDPVYVPTDNGDVPIHGTIDRIDIVEDDSTDKNAVVVRDYKTGGTPPGDQTTEGIRFQLPVYALLAESGLEPKEKVETVGGAYYKLKAPDSVSNTKGTVSSTENATHGQSNDIAALRYWSKSGVFESHTEFRSFVEDTTARRIGHIDEAVREGVFSPTVLKQGDAGCSYCPYSDTCDVRPKRRLEKIEAIDDTDTPAYVPAYARESTRGDE
jgi:ATP-dependent helicase/nuclease subunit B